jgi:prepilin-type N-terminal cleavage/methylation domain-containing protein
MKRAFSLIEILVVIGIIAILAAILFPVFNSVKLAAKSTQSLSNLSQLGTAVQLYMHDYDETVVLSGTWNSPDTGTDPFSIPPNTVATWSWLINPYIKDATVMLDPLAPHNGNVLTGGDDTSNDLFFPQYGMNYVYLTPYDVTTDPNNPAQRPVSLSMIAKPGATVFATSKYAYPETTLAANGYTYFKETPTEHNSPALWATVEVPDCPSADVDRMHLCNASWGVNDGYINSPTVVGVSSVSAGANTGGVALRASGNLAAVVFMDSHAKKMSSGALAAGTNWTPNIQAAMVTTISPGSYLWDLQ